MNSEQTKTSNAGTGNNTSQAASPKPDEKPIADKAAETLAGDNKYLAAILKILFSPIALLAGGALVIYWMSKKDKSEYEQLKQDYQTLRDDYDHLKRKYKKIKALLEPREQKTLPEAKEGINGKPVQKLSYRSSYLD